MKNKYLILIFLVLNSACAQKVINTEKGKVYYTDSRLNNFLGVWEYSNEEETFRIELLPKRYKYSKKSYADLVWGYHLYIKNGDTIQNSHPLKKRMKRKREGHTLYGVMKDSITLRATFVDKSKDKNGTVFLTISQINPKKLKWELNEEQGEKINLILDDKPIKKIEKGFTVPLELELTKVQ